MGAMLAHARHRKRERRKHQAVHGISQRHTSTADTPMGTENPMGNQPSCTANTIKMSKPSQNVGVETKKKAIAADPRSGAPPRRAPAATPSANPNTPLSSHAMPASAKQVGSMLQ